jgi:hypothetical protein
MAQLPTQMESAILTASLLLSITLNPIADLPTPSFLLPDLSTPAHASCSLITDWYALLP